MKYLLFFLITFNIFPAEYRFNELARELGHYPRLPRSISKSKIFKLKDEKKECEVCNICDQEDLKVDFDSEKKEEPQFHSLNHNARKHLEYINELMWENAYQAYAEIKKLNKYLMLNNLDFGDFANLECFHEYFGNLKKVVTFYIKKLAHEGDEKAIEYVKNTASIALTKKEKKKFLNE